MTEKAPSYTLSFDIFEAINREAPETLSRLLADNKQLLAGDGWDTNTQNLAFAEYLLTRNANQYIARVERKGVAIGKAVERANGAERAAALENWYFVHNWTFFRALSQRCAPFDEESLRALRFDFGAGDAPPFPVARLFLARLSYAFDRGDALELFAARGRLKAIWECARAAKAARESDATRFYVPLLCGARLYTLTSFEQNAFAPIEAEITFRIFKIAGFVLIGDAAAAAKSHAKAQKTLSALRAEEPGAADDALLSESPQPRTAFHPSALRRLCKHVTALLAFFSAAIAFQTNGDFDGLLAALNDEALRKNGRFRARYALGCTALLAKACAAPATAARLLANALATKPRKREGATLWEVGCAGGAIGGVNASYNLALMQGEAGASEASLAALEALIPHFSTFAPFWYRLGLARAQLAQKAIAETSARLQESYQTALADDQSKFPYSRVRRWSCNSQNVLSDLQKSGEPKNANITAALFAFTTVLRLLADRLDAAAVAERLCEGGLRPEKARRVAAIECERWRAYNNSAAEHLAYLHLLLREPLRALGAVARAVRPSPTEKAKLACYEAAALLQLEQPQSAVAALDAQLRSQPSLGRQPPFECFYAIGGANVCSVGARETLEYNRAVSAFYLADRTSRSAILDEYFDERELQRVSWNGQQNYELHFAYCYHYRERPCLQTLSDILKATDSAPFRAFAAAKSL